MNALQAAVRAKLGIIAAPAVAPMDEWVYLSCKACGLTDWLEAICRPGAWWYGGGPKEAAKRPHCKDCGAPPPLEYRVVLMPRGAALTREDLRGRKSA